MTKCRRDDHVLFKRFANRSNETGAHGGRLLVTNEGVTFRPHWIDRRFAKASSVVMPWTEISGIEVILPDRDDKWRGGLRRRLQVIRDDGTDELFVVNRIDWVASRVRAIQTSVAAGR